MMELHYIARKNLAFAIERGYRLIVGMEYKHDDWAICMCKTDKGAPSENEKRRILAVFERPIPMTNAGARNKTRGAISSCFSRALMWKKSA